MHYFYTYALQEDSLLKCFKSYFEETFYCTLFLVGLADRLHINRPEGKPTAGIYHHYFFTCETEMVLCGQVYCSNCILKSVLVEVRVHTSITNKKDSKSSGKTYSYQAVVDRGAQHLGGTPLSDSQGGPVRVKSTHFFSQWQIPQMVAKYTLKPLMVANEKTQWLRLSECLFSCLSPENESNTLISDFFSKK